MSIVINLQKKCLDKNENLQSLLREALVISTKLKLSDFKNWITCELKGYPNTASTPDYREVRKTLKFFNQYHGWIEAELTEEFIPILSKERITQPIGELEEIIENSKTDELIFDTPPDIKNKLKQLCSTDCQPGEFVNRISLYGIIEKVRTLLLEWTLKLEEDNILGNDNLIFTEEEKKTAQNIHIENFYGVMGEVDSIGNLSTGSNTNNNSNQGL